MAARSQLNIRLFWNLVVLAAVIGGLTIGFAFQLNQSKERVLQYFSVWEEELGRTLIISKDTSLLLKISQQLKDLDSTVSHSFARANGVAFGVSTEVCSFETMIPLSLSSLPVGSVSVCFSPRKIFYSAILSPIFMITLILTAFLASLAKRREWKSAGELLIAKEISDLSKQVAHDIRGPMMALRTLTVHSHELSLAKKELLVGATERIHNIAEDLLKRSRSLPVLTNSEVAPEKVAYCYLQEAIQSTLPELQARFQNVSLKFVGFDESVLIIGLEKSNLQRILSNLVQNAAEAVQLVENPYVSLQIHRIDKVALIEIIDNGYGIAAEDISAVLSGKSVNKANGNGLGLSGAKKMLEKVGGTLGLKSKINVGTQISLKIPLVSLDTDELLFDHET